MLDLQRLATLRTMSAPAGGLFPLPLLVISAAGFVSVTSEFLPTAVLPQIAAEFDIPASQVGFLVTLFALTVVVASAPLTIVTRRFSRKWLLVVMLALYVVSTLLAAVAPVYEVLAGARILAGLTHALFWAVAMPYVALLVPASQLTRAISVVTAGITLAFILGVPGGAA